MKKKTLKIQLKKHLITFSKNQFFKKIVEANFELITYDINFNEKDLKIKLKEKVIKLKCPNCKKIYKTIKMFKTVFKKSYKKRKQIGDNINAQK